MYWCDPFNDIPPIPRVQRPPKIEPFSREYGSDDYMAWEQDVDYYLDYYGYDE